MLGHLLSVTKTYPTVRRLDMDIRPPDWLWNLYSQTLGHFQERAKTYLIHIPYSGIVEDALFG